MFLEKIRDAQVRENVEKWLSFPLGAVDEAEIRQLVVEHKEDYATELLRERFCKRIQFGTAGLRARMESGSNRINAVTIMQTSQGIASHFADAVPQARDRGVAIGFDARHNSEMFAHIAAASFLAEGFKVRMSLLPCPTPIIAYACKKYNCACGVVVTASHNPKADNGYKVYGSNSAQIVSPTDEYITKRINQNLDQRPRFQDFFDVAKTRRLHKISLVDDITQFAMDNYINDICSDLLRKPSITSASDLKAVYTAMHGVGYIPLANMLSRFGFKNLFSVPEQEKPDPEFSTVAFPNPEENNALDLAMTLANSISAEVIIANDPDADRFAAAEKNSAGIWHVFHGDELGILFAAYRLDCLREAGVSADDMLFINSTVSSRMLGKFAEIEGCKYETTLTGFKWMANESLILRQNNPRLVHVLAYEEALGYQLSEKVEDKDGISAAAVWIEMCSYLRSKGETAISRLKQLREKYGYFVTNNSYFLSDDSSVFKTILDGMRNSADTGYPPPSIGQFKLKGVRDVTMGIDSTRSNGKCKFPLSPNSQMITLFFDCGATMTIRSSGTEPKLKWYAEMSGNDPEIARAQLHEIVETVVKIVLQPERYGLTRQS